MKHLAFVVLALAMFFGTANALTIEELQAQIDSIEAAQVDSGCIRAAADVDSIISNRDSLVTFGVTIVKHHADSMWVDIDLPVSTEEDPGKVIAMKLFYQRLFDVYQAQADDVPWRARVRKDRAKVALKWLDAQL